MATLKEFLTAQEGYNGEVATAVDGIVADVAKLNKMIEDLNNSPDRVTPEDQARIDALASAGRALADKAKAADELTAPDAPPPPPPRRE